MHVYVSLCVSVYVNCACVFVSLLNRDICVWANHLYVPPMWMSIFPLFFHNPQLPLQIHT